MAHAKKKHAKPEGILRSTGMYILLFLAVHLVFYGAARLEGILYYVFAGFIVSVASLYIRSLLNKWTFTLRTSIFYPTALNTFVSWLVIRYVSNEVLIFAIVAGVLAQIAYLASSRVRTPLSTKIAVVCILALIAYASPDPGETRVFSGISSILPSGASLPEGLSGSMNFNSIIGALTGCPQLDVPLEPRVDASWGFSDVKVAIFQRNKTYEDWTVKTHFVRSALATNIQTDGILCTKGATEGQNPDYLYCGRLSGSGFILPSTTGAPYIERRVRNADGTFGKTIRKGFTNVYDNEGEFLYTKCLPDPIAQDEKNIDSTIDDWMRMR